MYISDFFFFVKTLFYFLRVNKEVKKSQVSRDSKVHWEQIKVNKKYDANSEFT